MLSISVLCANTLHLNFSCSLPLFSQQKVPDADSSMAYRLFPTQIAEIGRLDDLIKGGTTVVTALIYQNKLYVANVGDSRALLCAQVNPLITEIFELIIKFNKYPKEPYGCHC